LAFLTKIISVGNIAMGGTGKTPVVIKLGEFFLSLGRKVSIISRGYKGKLGYSLHIISDGKKIYYHPPMAADEPYLIANILKTSVVVTCKDRKIAVEYVKQNFNPDIILLDDAFHRKDIKKDIDLLLIDYKNPISTGLSFPFGYLREPPSAIKRADIILFTKTGGSRIIPEKVKKYVNDKPVFFSDLIFKGIFLSDQLIVNKNLKFVAFSGIANNRQFFEFLVKNGVIVLEKIGFIDHHSYKEKDYIKLQRVLENLRADYFITTEKDYVKLNDEMKKMTTYVKIDIDIFEKENFFNFFLSKL